MECEDRTPRAVDRTLGRLDRNRGHSGGHVGGSGGHPRASAVKPLKTACPGDPFPCYLELMVWRLLAVLLVLTGTAWSAPIVIKCYDGSSSAIVRWPTRSAIRLRVCDLDHLLDGRCQFRVSLGATRRKYPRVFEMTLRAGRRKHVQYAGTTAVLECLAGPEPPPKPPSVEPPPGAVTYTCQDGVLVESSSDPVCDVDQAVRRQGDVPAPVELTG